MLIGQTLLAESTTPAVYYSPWFPRGGNAANFICDAISTYGLTSFVIQCQTKNQDQGDESAASIGSAQTITLSSLPATTAWECGTVDLVDAGGTGFKELCRFKFTVTASSGLGFVHFRILNPAWVAN